MLWASLIHIYHLLCSDSRCMLEIEADFSIKTQQKRELNNTEDDDGNSSKEEWRKNVWTRTGLVQIYETVRLLKLWIRFRSECFKVNVGKRYVCRFRSKRFMMQKISVVSDWNKFSFNVVCEDFAWSATKRSINFNSISSHPSASSSIDSDGIAMKAWKMFGLIKS